MYGKLVDQSSSPMKHVGMFLFLDVHLGPLYPGILFSTQESVGVMFLQPGQV